MSVRRKHIQAIVDRILDKHEVRRLPVPVERIASSLEIGISKEDLDEDLTREGGISGFLYRNQKSRRAVIGVNSSHPKSRQRFTIAHELGHFLLHDADGVHVDQTFQVKLRSKKSSEGTDREEKEANYFAAELLMPRRFLEADLAEIDSVDLIDGDVLKELADRYQVSPQSMTFRLVNLGYMTL